MISVSASAIGTCDGHPHAGTHRYIFPRVAPGAALTVLIGLIFTALAVLGFEKLATFT